uniref:Serum deprivation-response protein-like n=1 Tax=Pundamilia nyererei TaxID=303518 RepID=A0A3B4F077_9CICH
MVTTETHQCQDLLVPSQDQDQVDPENQQEDPASPSSLMAGLDAEKMSQGPVNAITVLTLLDKLVNMLDAVQENQHKMEVHQVEMEGVVKGIQADMTKLSKSQSFTSNTVSKLLDKSRKLSVTMKEMERQGMQVKKLEANHAHLINRNNFKVLIFQEENEIPSSVFVKDPPPYPRDEILEEGEEVEPGSLDGNRSQEGGLQTIDLSSDEDVGLEAEVEDEEAWPQDLENMEKSRAEKLKRSSLKKVDSLKKAFSRQNIEKKMTRIGTKIVSAEQREKIKQKTASLKVSPLSFHMRKVQSYSSYYFPETPPMYPLGPSMFPSQRYPKVTLKLPSPHGMFHQSLLNNVREEEVKEEEKEEEKQEEKEEETEVVKEQQTSVVVEADVSVVSEGVGEEYALSSTLPKEEKGEEEKVDES